MPHINHTVSRNSHPKECRRYPLLQSIICQPTQTIFYGLMCSSAPAEVVVINVSFFQICLVSRNAIYLDVCVIFMIRFLKTNYFLFSKVLCLLLLLLHFSQSNAAIDQITENEGRLQSSRINQSQSNAITLNQSESRKPQKNKI